MKNNWNNQILESYFNLFQELSKQGWRIEIDKLDQIDNGYWHIDKDTLLPYPDQEFNPFGDIALVTWSTYVYPPKEDDWVDELNASFDSPLEAYEWLAPGINRYSKKWKKDNNEN